VSRPPPRTLAYEGRACACAKSGRSRSLEGSEQEEALLRLSSDICPRLAHPARSLSGLKVIVGHQSERVAPLEAVSRLIPAGWVVWVHAGDLRMLQSVMVEVG
jgi:hypothetical protein